MVRATAKPDPRLRALPKTVNEDLFDRMLVHAHNLEKYSNAQVRDVVGTLNRDVLPALLDQLQRIIPSVLENGVTGHATRILQAIDSVRATMATGLKKIGGRLAEELKQFAVAEAEFTKAALKAAVPLNIDFQMPAIPTLMTLVDDTPMQGSLLSSWFDDLGARTTNNVMRAVNVGIIEGSSIGDIVSSIRGTRAANYTDGVLNATRAQAETLVRTAVAETSTQARMATYDENADVISKWQWVATLDPRTCPVCMALDGKTFPAGKATKKPPAHMRCRCTSVPITKSWKDLGIPGLKEPPPATRASMNGEVPDKINYGDWIKAQPASVQDQALGPTRAQLLRDGKVDVSSFSSNNQTLNLQELKDAEGLSQKDITPP